MEPPCESRREDQLAGRRVPAECVRGLGLRVSPLLFEPPGRSRRLRSLLRSIPRLSGHPVGRVSLGVRFCVRNAGVLTVMLRRRYLPPARQRGDRNRPRRRADHDRAGDLGELPGAHADQPGRGSGGGRGKYRDRRQPAMCAPPHDGMILHPVVRPVQIPSHVSSGCHLVATTPRNSGSQRWGRQISTCAISA